MSFHSTTVVGRLGKDPEMRYLETGTAMVTFSVAANTGFGENKKTAWFNMVAWGKRAEIINQLCQKGTMAHFECQYQQRQWENDEGETQYSHNFKVNEFTLLTDGRPKEETVETPFGNEDDDFPF